MKVVSYLSVVPIKNNNKEKTDVLHKYAAGVLKAGDNGETYTGFNLQNCDVAVIQGWQHEKGKTASHLRLRQQIIDHQLARKKYVCVADSNLFLYSTNDNSPHHYLRYSFNGVFPNSGIYCDTVVDPNRWSQISKDLNIKLEKEKTNGKNILVCLQRSGGWSMGSYDVVSWTRDVVAKIRKHTDRPIIVRTHPGDKSVTNYIRELKSIRSIKVSDPTNSLFDDLNKAWCVVHHNSSSIVGPLILGYPAFITDPEKSQCQEVAHTDFSQIENPRLFDRESWVKRISMFHWKFSELEDGTCWKHMKNYCQ
jgi:hypothetical protein